MKAKVIQRNSLVGAISGSLDNIDGDLLSGNDFATVTLADGTVSHYLLVADSAETPDDKLIVVPALNPYDKRWILVAPFGAVSHVNAKIEVVEYPLTNNADNTIIYDTVLRDDLDEYDETTGIFTAKYAGTYLVSHYNLCTIATWVTGEVLASRVDGTEGKWIDYVIIQNGIECNMGCSGTTTVRLAAGEIAYIAIHPVAVGIRKIHPDSGFNWITIDRLI